MATTTWEFSESPVRGLRHGPVGSGNTEVVGRLQDMGMVRRFVSEVLRGEGGAELTDDEWTSLCEGEPGVVGDRVAVAHLVLRAYAQRNSSGRHLQPPVPAVAPISFAAPASEVQSDDGEWLPSAGPESAVIETTTLPIPADFASAATATETSEQWVLLPESRGEPAAGTLIDGLVPEVSVTAWPMQADPVPAVARPAPLTPIERPRRSRRGRSERRRTATTAGPLVDRRSRGAPADGRHERRRERLLVATSWVRNIGIIILLFVSWQLWGTAITQHQSQDALKNQFEAGVHHGVVKPKPGFTLVPATTRIPDPPQGTVMARLQVPKIGLDEFVVSGTTEGDLAKGPGHYLGTAMPGQAGNVAIAGHRTTHGAPFNRLAELAIGDPIYLTTSSGQQLTYIVSAVPVPVSPRDVSVLNNFGDNRVTLTTCNPEYSAVQRLIVVAAYLPPGAAHPSPIGKGSGKPYALAPAALSGWNTRLLPLVAVELGALIALGLAFGKLSRAYGRGARWLILGPIWLALLLALFETLVNFLPAAV